MTAHAHMRTARTRARCAAAAPSRSRVCAAGFAWGYPGVHEGQCPPSYYPITTADACALAANITGKTYRGKAEAGPGCFLDFRDGYIYSYKGMFRDYLDYAQPLCSGLLASRAASAAHARRGADARRVLLDCVCSLWSRATLHPCEWLDVRRRCVLARARVFVRACVL